jgi:hypothetical protein
LPQPLEFVPDSIFRTARFARWTDEGVRPHMSALQDEFWQIECLALRRVVFQLAVESGLADTQQARGL